MEGDDEQVVRLSDRFERARGPAYFGPAGEKDENVAIERSRAKSSHCARDLRLEWPVVRALEVLDLDIERATLRAQDRAVAEVASDRRGIERGRHGDEAKVWSRVRLQPSQESERHLRLQVPLVEFVEQDGGNAAKHGVGDELSCEHALRDESDASPRPGRVFEADRVPDRLTEPLAELVGYAPGGQSSRDPAGLQNDDFASIGESCIEKRPWNTGGFSRAGGRFEHEGGALYERLANRG